MGRDDAVGAAMAATLAGVTFVRGDTADPDDIRRVVKLGHGARVCEAVRFNAVCRGQIATKMMDATLRQDDVRQRLQLRITAGRFGTPEEVADVVCWLLSFSSSYVNGAETAGLGTPRDLIVSKQVR